MILTGSFEGARANRNHRHLPNGAGFWRSELITVEGGAQAFLVEQEPHSVAPPHFHLEDEFQVFLAGDGTLGRMPVRPVLVHYANSHTGYGPINAGPDGITYMTLRMRLDLGAHFLPEERASMKSLPRRNLHSDILALSSGDELRERAETSLRTVIPVQPDEVAAWLLTAPARGHVVAPHRSADRFYLIANGAARVRGERLVRGDVVFVPLGDPDLDATADGDGAQILILQFSVAAAARR